MNTFLSITQGPVRIAAPVRNYTVSRGKSLATIAGAVTFSLGFAGQALAQAAGGAAGAASSTGGLGEQFNTMSSEAINAGGTGFGAACYLAAAACFFFGAWAFWQSRQPQNRESGHMGRALAGLVVCGLFVTAGTWINKAANTASGGNASINNAPAMVTFK